MGVLGSPDSRITLGSKELLMEIQYVKPHLWPDDPDPGTLLLRPLDASKRTRLAELALQEGVEAFVHAAPGPKRFLLPAVPVFDDMLALWILCDVRTAEVPEAVVRELCDYAAAARQALTPRGVPFHARPYAVLEEIRRKCTENGSLMARFTERSFELFELLAARVGEGIALFGEEVFGGSHRFREEVERLKAEERVYQADRARARIYTAQVPEGGGHRAAGLLEVDHPRSTLFRDLARSDTDSPGGEGFELLLIHYPKTGWVLSSDPALNIRIGFLAARLQAEEERRLGRPLPDDDPWFDGARFEHTVVAPPQAGTTLTRDDILAVLRRELALEEMESPAPPLEDELTPDSPLPSAWRYWLGSAAVAVALLVALPLMWTRLRGDSPYSDLPSVEIRGDEGATVADGGQKYEVGYQRMLALVVGIERYENSAYDLVYADDDAKGFRDALVYGYGFRPVRTASDCDRPTDRCVITLLDERAKRRDVLDTLQGMKNWLGPDDAMLLFWAGHGKTELSDGVDPGFLIPWDGQMDTGSDYSVNVPLEVVRGIMDDSFAKHRLMILDACYSGALLGDTRSEPALPAEPPVYVREMTRAKAFQIITATQADQQALDIGGDGHSVFTHFLLEKMREEQSYLSFQRLAAELSMQVAERADKRHHRQVPGYARVGTGDFILFRPTEDQEPASAAQPVGDL
jgi:hypothetical protein